MRLVELRDLDGPNLFLAGPAIKLELALDLAPGMDRADTAAEAVAALAARFEPLGMTDDDRPEGEGEAGLGALLADALAAIHERSGAPVPATRWADLEAPGHRALAFGWEHRRFALAAGRLLAAAVVDEPGARPDLRSAAAALADLLATTEPDDAPLMVRDGERAKPIVAVTGTNGKTTTTRMIAHILTEAGMRPGWSSTAGVWVGGEEVLAGDYSGPAGARRVLDDPAADVAVVETARGGILLRGLAFEHCDVAVFTNVSADHLGLHGVHTIEELARVKSVVVRAVRANGWAVLNADDPLVRGAASATAAGRFWVTQNAANPHVLADLADGGRALLAKDGAIIEARGDEEHRLVALADVPATFGGDARHMVENALCAAAACLALGVAREAVAEGLRGFGRDPAHNPGRNEVLSVRGATVVIDYAHNEVGLAHLLRLARGFVAPDGRLLVIVGSAGDRADDAIRRLGEVAAEGADRVLVKESARYLRGRGSPTEVTDLIEAGLRAATGAAVAAADHFPDQLAALDAALAALRPGDALAIMSFEETDETRARVLAAG
jgi:cyanophycin synthetase